MNAAWGITGALAFGLLAGAAWLHPRPKAPVPISKGRGELALEVQREGRALHVSWDRNSEAIQHSDHATLNIIDGIHNSKLELNAAEERAGKLVYWPETEQVTLHLEVSAPTGVTARTVQFHRSEPPHLAMPSESPVEKKPSPFAPPRRRHRLQQISALEESSLAPASDVPKSAGAFFGRLAHKIPLVGRLQKSDHRSTPSSD